MEKLTTIPLCPRGHADVVVDAWAKWNSEIQNWELSHTFDAAHCNTCDEDYKHISWGPPPKTKAFVATVRILLPAEIETHSEAADAISSLLSENLMTQGAILDWEYVSDENLVQVDLPNEGWTPDEQAIRSLLTAP